MRDSVKRQYTREWIQYDRPQTMYDKSIQKYITELLSSGDNFAKDPAKLMEDFKKDMHTWITSSKLNEVSGLDEFKDRDIVIGVTGYLDDLHLMKNCVVLKNEYKYHWRLFGDSKFRKLDELVQGDNLILSMPFPFYGDVHPDMNKIIEVCNEKQVNVHIDSAWYGCCRDIKFSYSEPCIKSAAFSLSKGLGLPGNRIGIRYCKERWNGPVSIMNDFNMNNESLVWLGVKFMNKFGSDYWWNKYGDVYEKVCKDFELKPTKAIHLALDNGKPVGVRPLMRCLKNE